MKNSPAEYNLLYNMWLRKRTSTEKKREYTHSHKPQASPNSAVWGCHLHHQYNHWTTQMSASLVAALNVANRMRAANWPTIAAPNVANRMRAAIWNTIAAPNVANRMRAAIWNTIAALNVVYRMRAAIWNTIAALNVVYRMYVHVVI